MMKSVLKLTPDFENKEAIILRDYLALERTRLANETTLLSYIKAALYLFLSGLAVKQVEGFGNISWIGTIALVLSVMFALFGVVRFVLLRNRLRKYYRFSSEESPEDDAEKP